MTLSDNQCSAHGSCVVCWGTGVVSPVPECVIVDRVCFFLLGAVSPHMCQSFNAPGRTGKALQRIMIMPDCDARFV